MSELIELISKWENFKHEFPEGAVADFGEWINSKKKLAGKAEKNPPFNAADAEFDKVPEQHKATMQAGYLIGKLYQYILIYSKPLMKKYGLHSMDDFGYLATVDWHQTISKSKACAAMLQEVTTGSDIIKRLLRLGYLKETPDNTDRRQKFLQLTIKGKKVLASLQTDFQSLPDVLGELELENRLKLVGWMMELDEYHDRIVRLNK
jgi:DNA-binding MarR family transcriptional regulator